MKSISEFSKKMWSAIQSEDVAYLKENIHEEAMFIHMGVSLKRDEELDVIKSRKIVYQHIEFETQTITEMASIAIVYNKLKLTAIVNGNEVTNPFVITEVYTNDAQGLKLASMSFTKIVY